MNLLSADTGKKVRFELSAEPGKQVFVAGTFNDWSTTANPMKDNPGSGHCKATLRIPTGTHEYKFIVNGIWMADPKCKDWTANEHGSMNSVLHV
jgi:1,4-alpha-glucan branching enzyme